MLKAALTLVLVATQTLSCGAAPLYLCLSHSGAVCVDFGPEHCDCCHEDAGHDHACDQACEHACAEGESDSDAPCGCTHIQLSEPQTATVQRAVVAADADHWLLGLTILPADLQRPLALDVAPACSWALASDSPPLSLTVLQTVVLRC